MVVNKQQAVVQYLLSTPHQMGGGKKIAGMVKQMDKISRAKDRFFECSIWSSRKGFTHLGCYSLNHRPRRAMKACIHFILSMTCEYFALVCVARVFGGRVSNFMGYAHFVENGKEQIRKVFALKISEVRLVRNR